VRELYTARLIRKVLLSQAEQCYHFEFEFEREAPAFEAGQFLSLITEDPLGKSYTRAYSLASAPRGQAFDLCVNRVEGAFFSNLLCDMREGATVKWHGPHGMFTLKQPLTDTLLIAGGTGIAPMRGFLDALFRHGEADRSQGRAVWLVYEGDEFFYDEMFREIAARCPNFRYRPVRATDREGAIRQAAAAVAGNASLSPGGDIEQGPHAYVCGLAALVKPARAQLIELGWPKPRVLFERYD
jgi:ferredoxin-NADP reductase